VTERRRTPDAWVQNGKGESAEMCGGNLIVFGRKEGYAARTRLRKRVAPVAKEKGLSNKQDWV